MRRINQAQQTLSKNRKLLDNVRATKAAIAGETPTTSAIVEDTFMEERPVTEALLASKDRIVFKPNTGPQTQFLAASEDEVFYGGARGGGKSYAMLVDPLRDCDKKNHRAVIIRRTMPELRDLIVKSHFLYPKAYPGAKWKEQDKVWTFPSGARIEFGYVENMQDVMRYQGQSYTWIGVDELPQFPNSDVWDFLRSSNRSVDPTIRAVMRATGNPGNIGSLWVKEMYIDPAEPNTTFYQDVEYYDNVGKKHVARRSMKFIPAKVWDNPYLTYDHRYVAALASLPEAQRKQFLEGSWDVIEGAAFPEFDRNVHVIAPFLIPTNWPKFRACDWGYSSKACCLWFAVDFDHNLYVYRELYVDHMNAEQFADRVLELEKGENISYGVLDASTWADRGDVGPTIAETMIRRGCRWRPSDRRPNSRVNGKLEVHRRLAISEETKTPRLRIFSTCLNLIRTLPVLPLDENNAEDVNTKSEDHAYDALRYGCSSRPVAVHDVRSVIPMTTRNIYNQVLDNTFGY